MQGRFVVGAAHFEDWLPAHEQSTLASINVPAKHLSAGTARKAHRLAPRDCIAIEKDGEPVALVRLFEAPIRGSAAPRRRTSVP